jgi:hypothetical protein
LLLDIAGYRLVVVVDAVGVAADLLEKLVLGYFETVYLRYYLALYLLA